MAFLNSNERGFLRAVSNLGYGNPFLPERIQYEREALGRDFREAEPVWSMRVHDPDRPHDNILKIMERVETVVRTLRDRLAPGTTAAREDVVLYEDAALFMLYHGYRDHFSEAILRALDEKRVPGRIGF